MILLRLLVKDHYIVRIMRMRIMSEKVQSLYSDCTFSLIILLLRVKGYCSSSTYFP